MDLNFELFGRCLPVKSAVMLSQRFMRKENIVPTFTNGQGDDMGVWYWAAFHPSTWTTCCNGWNHEFCSLQENPDVECLNMSGNQFLTSSTIALMQQDKNPNTPASPPLNDLKKH